MVCGTCGCKVKGIRSYFSHVRKTGCDWRREVWEKVAASRARGSSGRRILAKVYPHLYRPRPMSEETKARLRELNEKRKGVPKLRRRRR